MASEKATSCHLRKTLGLALPIHAYFHTLALFDHVCMNIPCSKTRILTTRCVGSDVPRVDLLSSKGMRWQRRDGPHMSTTDRKCMESPLSVQLDRDIPRNNDIDGGKTEINSLTACTVI